MRKFSEIMLRSSKELIVRDNTDFLAKCSIRQDTDVSLPVLVIIDASESMSANIEAIRDSLKLLRGHEDDCEVNVDMAIISSGSGKIELLQDFSDNNEIITEAQEEIIDMLSSESCWGISPLCIMLNIGYEKLMKRCMEYESENKKIITPAIVVFSDFCPNDFSKTDAFKDVDDMFEIFGVLRIQRETGSLDIIKVLCSNDETPVQIDWFNSLSGAPYGFSDREVMVHVINDLCEKGGYDVKKDEEEISDDEEYDGPFSEYQ